MFNLSSLGYRRREFIVCLQRALRPSPGSDLHRD
jgi:hypothetical protein